MNALRKFIPVAAVLVGGIAIGPGIAQGQSQAAAKQAPASKQETLNREQVASLLAQAQQAIAKGDFAQAEGLTRRAEASGIRYPLLHMGETPTSVRRALERAKLASNPVARASNGLIDPFVKQASANQPTTPLANQPRTLPTPTGASMAMPAQRPAEAAGSKDNALLYVDAARKAIKAGNFNQAQQYAVAASQMNVPESAFAAGEDSPARLAWDLQKLRYQQEGQIVPVAAASEAAGDDRYASPAALAQPQSVQPATLVGPAGNLRLAQNPSGRRSQPSFIGEPAALPAAPAAENIPRGESPADLIEQGEQALKNRDLQGALRLFKLASKGRGQLSSTQQARLDNHLQMFAAAGGENAADNGPTLSGIGSGSNEMMDSATSNQDVLVRQLSVDIGKRQLEAKRLRESEPRKALELLKDTRKQVADSKLPENHRATLLRRVDAAIADTDKYISDHRAQIELDEANAAVMAEVDRRRSTKLKVQNQIAELVDQFNKLRDEQRYEEAELIAKRLYELAPNEEVSKLILSQAKFIRRNFMNEQVRNDREEGNYRAYEDIERTSVINVFDNEEMTYGKGWDGIKNRKGLNDANNRRTERELEIEQKLKTPVQLSYENRPLSEVIEALSQMTGVNIHLDPRGLSQEGVSSDSPVSLDLKNEIMLKSALNLILEPLHLSFLVKDEVLKITSEQLRDGEIKPQTYYVADLVTPIPNFVPSSNFGLQGLINDAHAALGYGGNGLRAPGPITMVNGRNQQGGPNGDLAGNDILAQSPPGFTQGGGGAGNIPFGGPGGAGGGANADFDSLIDLIISTVASETWAENGGGEAEIRPYFNNLSLVVSQTQAVHEEIADLLEQLRRLQDLQITIEVRFIRLNDSFFERIGMDFDVNINDKTQLESQLDANGNYETPARGATVGLAQQIAGDLGSFTNDLDVPFRQDSFSLAVPQFGGPVAGGASFGFAILSDIEAYFLINAAQGDRRTNVLNAPKVTLFNGQTAFVADTSSTPFVISVIPVVGEFAAAQQPVIVVLNEGTLMNIQAVVSEDRRYVRLTVVPFFSEIGDVQTFTFEGSTTTSSSSSTTDDDDDGNDEGNDRANNNVMTGTTVQLPTFQFVTVSTTVSVPDGGTVLLGGIKRLNEGRNEFGVPLLSKLPYINRLFRNVGIGRETDSLMMMVTPRIIIQEEEEAKLGAAGL